ncbi:MAG: hypothetical protein ABEJ04_01765, partial [Halobacteriaceae archaeon]
LAGTCTCPDYEEREPEGGCKHVQRVKMELEANTIPRPDGKLPDSALAAATADAADTPADSAKADAQHAEAAIIDAIQEREEEIARLQSEIEALEAVTDTFAALRNPDEEFSLDVIGNQSVRADGR